MSRRKGFTRLAWAGIALLLLVTAAPGFSVKNDPVAVEFYHLARHFMTRQEEKTFANLSTAEFLREFIARFWAIRDPDPNTEENEFRTAVQERFEYVNRYLNEGNRPGWDTARGMVYMVLGPPSLINAAVTSSPLSNPRDNLPANTIVWPYLELYFNVYFVDRQGFGTYELDLVRTSPRLLELLKTSKTQFIRDGGQGLGDSQLKFKAEIEPARDRLVITIEATQLRFDIDADGKFTARIHLVLNVYPPDGTVVSQEDDRRIPLDMEAEQKSDLRIEWSLPLKKGESRIDLLVLDQVSGRSSRQFYTVKKK